MLKVRPLCVCEILEVLNISGGTLSKHLKVLKEAGIVNTRKDGKWIEYYINSDQLKLINALDSFISDKEQILKDIQVINSIDRSVCSNG